MSALDKEYRHRITLRLIRAMVVLMIIGTFARFFLMSYMTNWIAWLGVANVALASLVYLIIRGNYLPRLEAELVVGFCLFVVIPLFVSTGGVNSQYIYLMPLVPMLAALLGGVVLTCAIAVILVLTVILMFVFAEQVPDLTGYPFVADKTRVRAVWLVFSVLVASGFGVYFRRSHDEQAQLLDRLAAIDHLTGLLNRRGLESRLEEELQRAARSGQALSVLMIDVDYFKQFNDQHGHSAGDNCLIQVARCLRKHTRAEDVVSRYGGEEFLVVLTNADTREAATVAEKLREAITEIDPMGCGNTISVTIGAASMAAGTVLKKLPAPEDLIRRADEALYRGKEAGRNRVESSAVELGGLALT